MRVTKADLLIQNDFLVVQITELEKELAKQKFLVKAMTAHSQGTAVNTMACTLQRIAESTTKLSDAAVEMVRSRR